LRADAYLSITLGVAGLVSTARASWLATRDLARWPVEAALTHLPHAFPGMTIASGSHSPLDCPPTDTSDRKKQPILCLTYESGANE